MPYDDFWVFHSLHNFEVSLGKKGEKFHHLEIKGNQIYIEECLNFFLLQVFFK
jgi:hypothetical protein